MSLRRHRPSYAATSRARTAAVLGTLVVLGSTALAGCAAGQDAETAHEVSVIDGVNTNVGAVGLRDAGVIAPKTNTGYAAGGTAPLTLSVTNSGQSADQLTSVSSASATSVTLSPATVSTGAATSSAPGSTTAVTVPAQGLVEIGGTGNAQVVLRGLKESLIPGQSITVSFTFRDAGTAQVTVPVRLIADQTGGATVDVSPSSAD